MPGALKSKFDNDGLWPVFEERDGKCFVAFFQAGMRKTSGPSSHRTLFGRFPKPCDHDARRGYDNKQTGGMSSFLGCRLE